MTTEKEVKKEVLDLLNEEFPQLDKGLKKIIVKTIDYCNAIYFEEKQ